MGIAFGVGMLLVLIALASGGGGKAQASQVPATVPPDVKKGAEDAAKGTASPAQLQEAAKQASEAGLPQTAAVLETKADALAEERAPLPKVLFSPLSVGGKKVADEAWTAYVNVTGDARYQTIGPSWNLGRWLLGARTLSDLALMTGIRKEDHLGRSVYKGTFVDPYPFQGKGLSGMTVERWLAAPRLQYEAFAKLSTRQAKTILDRYGKKEILIDGKPATLSGLLAVAKQAGMGGLDKWIGQSEAERQKYPNTYRAFQKANGLF